MKCKYCGHPLEIEDKFCPACGRPNELAVEHRKYMSDYEEKFEKTRTEVEAKTRVFARFTIPIIVIFVLVILAVVSVVIRSHAWEWGYDKREAALEANAADDREQIEEYLDDEDYGGACEYWNGHSLYASASLDEYTGVIRAAQGYNDIFETLLRLKQTDSTYSDEYLSSMISWMAVDIVEVYNTESEYDYDRDLYFSDDRMEDIYKIRNATTAILAAYGNMTREEAESFAGMYKTGIEDFLEGRLTVNE